MGEDEEREEIVEKLALMEEARIKATDPEDKALFEGWIQALQWTLERI